MSDYSTMSDADLMAAYKSSKDPFGSALEKEGVTGKLADVARSIYQQESGGGRNTKTSNAGAVGGMQIIPSTFASVADKGWDINDPVLNARAGIRYLKQLDKQSGGDPALTAAGYYGGPGGMEKARQGVAVSDPRNPNAPTTLQYSQQVAARLPQRPVVDALNNAAGVVMGSANAAQSEAQNAYSGMSDADLMAAYTKSKNGVTPSVSLIPTDGIKAPASTESPATDTSKDTALQRYVVGPLEAPLAVATGMAGGMVGSAAGALKSLFGGKYGTAEGVRDGQKTAEQVGQALTYQPRTQTGAAISQTIGQLANDSGIMAVAPMSGELAALSRAKAPAVNALRDVMQSGVATTADAAATTTNKLSTLIKPKIEAPAMRGGGAAVTEESTLRTQRAADLPVPITLTKGQSSRSFQQQQFERETAKLPEGAPLRERFADQNQQMISNFDSFMDSTGAWQTGLRGAGESVVNALTAKQLEVKQKIRDAYTVAKDAGAMSETVDIAPLQAYIEKNRAAMKNAPLLSSVEDEVARLSKNTGSISINDIEELRKMTGRLAQPGTPNLVYGQDVKKLIDSLTEGKGGPEYQQARRMVENYKNRFDNKQVVDRLLSDRPGTKDRTVAFEDVFNHSILKGSLDDVRTMRTALQTAGPEGAQAWRELQGQTISHIKETITGNSARDVRGNPIVSPDKLNKLVANLDADGKLDVVFGKQGAAKIRDINDLAKDVYTAPPGSVNSSNTSSAIMAALDLSSSAFTGLPLPVATTINYGIKRYKSKVLDAKVQNALANIIQPPP